MDGYYLMTSHILIYQHKTFPLVALFLLAVSHSWDWLLFCGWCVWALDKCRSLGLWRMCAVKGFPANVLGAFFLPPVVLLTTMTLPLCACPGLVGLLPVLKFYSHRYTSLYPALFFIHLFYNMRLVHEHHVDFQIQFYSKIIPCFLNYYQMFCARCASVAHKPF